MFVSIFVTELVTTLHGEQCANNLFLTKGISDGPNFRREYYSAIYFMN